MKFLVALSLLLGVVYGHGPEAPSCPPFWTGFGNLCVRYFPDALNYADAEATCAQFAPCNSFEIGSLAVLSERNRESFLKTYLDKLVAAPPASDVWIGLSDRLQEGVFTWTSGEPVIYKNFAAGQPDNGRTSGVPAQNCVMYSPALNGWDDVQCDLTLPFFCAMPREEAQIPGFGPGGPAIGGPGTGHGAGPAAGPAAGPGQQPGPGGPGAGNPPQRPRW